MMNFNQLKVAFSCLFSLSFLAINAQFNFTNSNDLLQTGAMYSGVAIAVADMNNDGLDDIVRMDDGRILNIELQAPTGGVFTNVYGGVMSGESQWSVCVADLNNDGYCEVISGGSYDGVHIARLMSDATSYEISEVPDANLFVQGSNFADINNDGWVDYFACHDDAESQIWGNDGAGNLALANDWIDMASTPVSDNSGNYGSIWTDFDNDGDLDLYIAKCRQGVGDPTDPRRINTLFENNGDGTYTENAAAYGLKIGAQSWTADFNDIDNDGDMDVFITNHDVNAMLLLNNDGMFEDIAMEAGVVLTGFPLQGVMRDFDNDGFVDIIVSGGLQQFFHNNGDLTFTPVEVDLSPNKSLHSYAIGDLNNDGFLDIYGGYANSYTSPSNTEDILWLNEGNDNNYLTINTIGQFSNRAGIGARIEIYGEWGIQIREVRAGESYGIMNSLNTNFGLGTATSVDSLIIRWPSGMVDIIDEIGINQLVTIYEGGCVSPNASVSISGETTICEGDIVTLTAPDGFEYLWSNDATTQSIEVGAAGTYNVTITDEEGCFGISGIIAIVVNPDATPTVAMEGETSFCEGGTVLLTASEADSYLWSNGATTQSIQVAESGVYNVTVDGLCEAFTSADFEVNLDVIATAANPISEDISVGYGNTATLTASGENPHWYATENAIDVLVIGDEFVTPPIVDSPTTYWVEAVAMGANIEEAVGMEAHSGSNFSGGQYNSQIIFDAFEAFTLKTVKVYTDTPGERTIELRAANGTVLESAVIYVAIGEHILDLNFEVPAGNELVLTTNTAANNTNFGENSPRLRRNNEGVNYPYIIEDIVSLNESDNGTDFYYYFYNWQIEVPGVACPSDRIPVMITFTGVNEIVLAGTIDFYPNPTTGKVAFTMPENSANGATIQVFSLTGALIQTRKATPNTSTQILDLQRVAKGVYWVKVVADDAVYAGRVVVQ